MKLPAYCYITSWIILIQGIIAYTYIPNELTLAHILMGLTSIIHHNRRDKYYYYDIIRFTDLLAVYTFFYLFYSYFGYYISLFIFLFYYLFTFMIYLLSVKLNNFKISLIAHCGFHLYFIITIPKFYSLLLR